MLLIVAIVALLVQLFGPAASRWWLLPRPGVTGIDYLPSSFLPADQLTCLAPGYVCHLPADYPGREEWPLVVFLHGSGQRGIDPKSLLTWYRRLVPPDSREIPTVIVLPQCLSQQSWQQEDVAEFAKYACQRYRIDKNRIYLAGHSMGGFGVWASATEYTDLFAAIVPVSGGGNPEKAGVLAEIPIWAFHGARDDVVPVDQTTRLIEAIRAAGGNPKLTILSESGHGIPAEVWRTPELWTWLLQQSLETRHTSQQEQPGAVGEKGN